MNAPLPARMLNEVAYCPRLYALEHLAGEWADNADTADGRRVHRVVDRPTTAALPEPAADPDRPRTVRSVELADDALGLVAKIDLCDVRDDGAVIPIDYKRGRAPEIPEGAWEPERVQVCAQILLLRAHGYDVPYGELYFAGSRRRVRVEPTDDLIGRTLALRDEAARIAATGQLPPPLVDSPKCPRCSLVGICLPDETNQLLDRSDTVRPIVPPRDDAAPLVVVTPRAFVGKDAQEITVKDDGKVIARARIADTSAVILQGAAGISTPLLHALAERNIPVFFHAFSGRLVGWFTPASTVGGGARIAQHRAAADPARALEIARGLVQAKIHNSRVLLRRNGRALPEGPLAVLKDAGEQVLRAADADALRGVEGWAARTYFEQFSKMLDRDLGFSLDGRNRRPPRDPVNALLSFCYAQLAREVQHAILRVGLDPNVAFLHQPRPGRPALSLDLMEEFRPVIADSVVVSVINNEVVRPDDFIVRPTGVTLGEAARRRLYQAFDRRLDEEATHPQFGTKLSMRRNLEVQVRLFARMLTGEIARYPAWKIR